MTENPRVFGADYSVYVRIVRLCLIEKGVEYELLPIDVFAKEGPPQSYLARHPFGRIPAFEHAGFWLYETSAIARYIDETFGQPKLQPPGAKARARCNQLLASRTIMHTRSWFGTFTWNACRSLGEARRRVRRGSGLQLPKPECVSRRCPSSWATTAGLAGAELTLADLYAAPMFDYFLKAPEGRNMIREHENLATWWSRVAERPSMKATAPT
jgi:glutathione S-transferase